MVPTCVELYLKFLQNFVRNIPTLLNFVKKIPTHGTKCKTSSCSVGIISTSVGIILTHYVINRSYTIQQCGNISYKTS